jgi:PASTA domain
VMLVASALIALTAGSARAATVTVGSSLQGAFEPNTSLTVSTRANLAVPPPGTAVSPVDGTAVAWSFIGRNLAPRVIRPIGGGLYTGTGTGPSQVGAGENVISGPFAINLPIKAGDLFGVDVGQSIWSSREVSGAALGRWPPLADGGPGDDPDPLGEELAVQAIVRYCLVPKLKGKKPKKAKRALRAADCTVGTVREGRKARKKRVVMQSVTPGSSISDTQPVDLRVSRKR